MLRAAGKIQRNAARRRGEDLGKQSQKLRST